MDSFSDARYMHGCPMKRTLFIGLALSLFWCGTGLAALKSAWVVSNGFHSSLALRAADCPWRTLLPQRSDYVLIGWGASDFYRGHTDLGTTLRSVFWVNKSALHLIPVQGALARRFPRSDIIRVDIPAAQFQTLLRELDGAFAKGDDGKPVHLGQGMHHNSRFFEGSETFWLGRMCNVWVGGKLRKCGVRLFVPGCFLAPMLLWQVERSGVRERRRIRPLDAF